MDSQHNKNVEERVQVIMSHFSRPWRWFCDDAWIVLEPPLGIITAETMSHVSQHADARAVEAVFRATPHPGVYLQFRLRASNTITNHPTLPRARR